MNPPIFKTTPSLHCMAPILPLPCLLRSKLTPRSQSPTEYPQYPDPDNTQDRQASQQTHTGSNSQIIEQRRREMNRTSRHTTPHKVIARKQTRRILRVSQRHTIKHVSIPHTSQTSHLQNISRVWCNLLDKNTLKHNKNPNRNNHNPNRRHNPMNLRTIKPGPRKDEQPNRNQRRTEQRRDHPRLRRRQRG